MPLASSLTKFTTASPQLVTYNYTDISSGTGYETYYLIESEVAAGKDYHLTQQNDYSNSVSITVASGSSDLDYDLSPFVIPRTVDGTVLVSIPIYGVSNITPTYAVYVYKWDGASETELGSCTYTTSALTTARMLYMTMDIDNELIAAGETLRVRVNVTNASGTPTLYGIDPANRTDANLSITTSSKIHIPYKLDS